MFSVCSLSSPFLFCKLLSPYPGVVAAGSPPAPTPSPVDEMSGSTPLSLGCYRDEGVDRIMDDLALADYSMTTEVI